jgi:tetratricopeptide (TPR) repeat protein
VTVAPSRAHRGTPTSPWRVVAIVATALAALPAAGEQAEPSVATQARASLDDVIEPLLTRIEAEEARNGQFSPNLIELLGALGLAYQEYGEHELARAILDRVLYLQRFNEGLFNLDQAPILERLIDSELALGRADSAGEAEARLLELVRRNPDDLRGVPILRDAAERDVDYYERYLRGDLPPVLTINDPNARERSVASSIRRARRNFREAIGTLVRNGAYDSANLGELAELEEGLTHTYYLEASAARRASLDPTDWATVQRAALYSLGQGSYQRRVEYTKRGSTAAVDHARALVELGDWSLLFSRNGTALKAYAEAYDLLLERRVPEASIRELFPVDTPVFLPAFAPNPLDPSETGGLAGHLDVDFEIGKYGQPRRVKIVAASDAAAAERSREVVIAIARGRYRPSPLAGPETDQEFRLRYSLADGTLTPRL